MPSNEPHALCKGTPSPATLAEILTREAKLAEEVDQYGNIALHNLCSNNNVTLELIELYLKHAPGAAEVVDKKPIQKYSQPTSSNGKLKYS